MITQLRNLCLVISKVLATDTTLIEPQTKKMLSKVIYQMVKKEARSFVIGGLYAISLESVGPVSTLFGISKY